MFFRLLLKFTFWVLPIVIRDFNFAVKTKKQQNNIYHENK